MPIVKTCENCTKQFSVKPKDHARKFCCVACLREYESVHGRAVSRVPRIEIPCKICGTIISLRPGDLATYRNKHGKAPQYCSAKCMGEGFRAAAEARNVFTCEHCGKEHSMKKFQGDGRVVYYRAQRFCSKECMYAHRVENRAEQFAKNVADGAEIPRHQKRNGYWVVSVPSGVTGKKHSVFEHRFVMEQHIGRKLLPEETVHHVDGNRSNNALENLELFSSRHGPGQRVIDKVAFAIAMLQQYPDFAAEAGFKLCKIGDCGCGH